MLLNQKITISISSIQLVSLILEIFYLFIYIFSLNNIKYVCNSSSHLGNIFFIMSISINIYLNI